MTTQYQRGALWRMLFGRNWRDVWSAPMPAARLDLAAFAGGLTPYKAGGNQSSTLHFHAADGRSFVFRSMNKNVEKAVPKDMRQTPVGAVVQDQTSALHPTGSLAAAVLEDAFDVLHVMPTIVYLPDDARLGEYRKRFANMVGQLEEKPEGDDSASSSYKVVSTEKMIEELEQSARAHFDEREYLKARLVDYLIGDTDRGADNWDWAQYKRDGQKVYRAFPRDRDYAFMRAQGPVASAVMRVYPKLTRFRPEFPKLSSLEFMTTDFDRSHLVELTWPEVDSIAADMQRRLTDSVIDSAIAAIPAAHRTLSGAVIREGLQGRRTRLRSIARDLYMMVSAHADVFGTDDDERADIDRNADGSVTVRLYGQKDTVPEFERRFTPDVTKEIRVYMERGNDRVVVRGNVEHSIQLRVTGGEGDDVLIDSGYVANGDETRFYDASGQNQLIAGRRTEIITTPYVMPQPMRSLDPEDAQKKPEKNPRTIREERRGRFQDLWVGEMGDLAAKTQAGPTRNWGEKLFLLPAIGYHDGPGVILGAGPTATHYGFRRTPHEWQAGAQLLYGVANGGFGVQLEADRYFEVSRWSVSVFAHATKLESNRFFGYGNDSPFARLDSSLVMRDELLIEPAINYSFNGTTTLSLGPIARVTRPHPATSAVARETFSQVGARVEFATRGAQRGALRQRGVDFALGGSAYPSALDVSKPFEEAHALARAFVPLGWPTLALRAGGKRVWGDFPLHEAAFIGASESLRGYRWNRFAGDASAYGSAELHLPLGRITLLTRGEFGLIGFVDAGRVWLDGVSNGTWHTGNGAGVSFSSLGQTLSLTYAKGEEGRVYFGLGFPF